jgi:hypothetical protein
LQKQILAKANPCKSKWQPRLSSTLTGLIALPRHAL